MTSKLLPIAAVAAVLAGCETFTASEPDPGIEEWAGATWPDAPANAMARTTTYRMWITDNDGAIDGTIQTEATDTTRETVSGHRRSGDEMTLYMPWSDCLLDGGISDGTWTADKMCRNDTTVVVMVSLQDRDPSYLTEILRTGGIKGTLTQADVPARLGPHLRRSRREGGVCRRGLAVGKGVGRLGVRSGGEMWLRPIAVVLTLHNVNNT